VAQQRFQTEPYGFGVSTSSSRCTGVREQLWIDVERLLHMDEIAIPGHAFQPYRAFRIVE
jgi:hypothetical protein